MEHIFNEVKQLTYLATNECLARHNFFYKYNKKQIIKYIQYIYVTT